MFYPIKIEPTPAFGFIGGPEFSTLVVPLENGATTANIQWPECRHKYTAPYHNISDDAFKQLLKVFKLMRGRAHSFLFRDWLDYEATDEVFGIGDGVQTVFQLSTTISDGGASYTRTITKPDPGIVVKAAGAVTAVTVATANGSVTDGQVTFAAPPALGAVLTWTGTFCVEVQFDVDYLPFTINSRNANTAFNDATLDLVEKFH